MISFNMRVRYHYCLLLPECGSEANAVVLNIPLPPFPQNKPSEK
jgi:hypothetical protein